MGNMNSNLRLLSAFVIVFTLTGVIWLISILRFRDNSEHDIVSPIQVVMQQESWEFKLMLGIFAGLFWGMTIEHILEKAHHLETRGKSNILTEWILRLAFFTLLIVLIYVKTVVVDVHLGPRPYIYTAPVDWLPFYMAFVVSAPIAAALAVFCLRKRFLRSC